MDTIATFIQYNGYWNDKLQYTDFSIKGLLIPKDSSMNNLEQLLANQLQVNLEEENLKIKYQVKPDYPPLIIQDNDALVFYFQMKSKQSDPTQFPLCIEIEKKMRDISLYVSSSRSTQQNINRNAEVCQQQDNSTNIDNSESVSNMFQYATNVGNLLNEDQEVESPYVENMIIDEVKAIEIEEGQKYKDKRTLKTILSIYAINNHFQFRSYKSCKIEYIAICNEPECEWKLRSSRNKRSNVFIVRKFNKVHSCKVGERMADKRQATSDLIGNFVKDKYANFKTVYTPADIIRDMKKEYGIELTYQKAWRSKEKGLELTRGNPAESYRLLPSYLHALKSTNPGSVAELETKEERFLYVFISLNASIQGWGFCKPVIVVDGTFLKAAYGGTLLTAATQDAANKIFPLAFCVVDSENDASWEWFFNKVRETFGLREGMCIISDRHDSIKKAIEKVYPEAHHGICTYHLFNNVKARYRRAKGEIREHFFGAAKAYTLEQFGKHMEELDKFDPKIREYLNDVGFEKWTTLYSTNNRYSTMTSNIAESLNATNIAARELPITTMLEFLRSLVQKWTHANRICARSLKTDMSKVAEDILNENYIRSLHLTVSPANDNIYTVTKTKTPFSVNLETGTCCCRRFQTDRIPCAHAVAVIRKYNKDPLLYCSKYYMKETYVNTYNHTVYPMTNKSTWNTPQEIKDIIVLPPESRTKSGRPKKKRILGGHEKKSKNKCEACKKTGHNKKTCRR
ncbi:uncharacterized protein LOC126661941 [Mercurialis annua]|uniref:uncharacterized protein LOC126661941 n=1 Tax=Mercurialis annua TaxID=3986 RepID=UPI0021602F39|nr:uncharacterized protein LOC126661941 [Mercurialis annua]